MTGTSPSLDLSMPSVTLAVRRDDAQKWWVLPALASAGSLALGIVLGALIFGGQPRSGEGERLVGPLTDLVELARRGGIGAREVRDQ